MKPNDESSKERNLIIEEIFDSSKMGIIAISVGQSLIASSGNIHPASSEHSSNDIAPTRMSACPITDHIFSVKLIG